MIRHMFTPQEIDEDVGIINEIKEDVESECSKFGPIKKIRVFDRHPDGVVSVKYEDEAAMGPCIAVSVTLHLSPAWQ